MKFQISGIVFSLLVLIVLSSFVSAQEFNSLGDAWNAIKSSLSNAEKSTHENDALQNYQEAVKIYDDYFKSAALEVDPESNQLITESFANIEQFLKARNVDNAKLERQIVDKTIYKIAFMKMEQAFKNNDASQFLKWYDVIEKKFKISEKPEFQTNTAIMKISQDPDEFIEYYQVIKDEILGIFKLKTLEEIEEALAALQAGKLDDAKKFAYEGFYYYRTLHPDVLEKLGFEKASELLHEMEEVIEITESQKSTTKMIDELQKIQKEVELIIREYEGGDTSTLGLALSGIKDRLVLVEEEYADAVSNGIIVNQEEYDETIVFLQKAMEIFEQNKESLTELSASDSSSLFANMQDIESVISALESPSKVSISVGKALNDISSLQQLTGGEAETNVLQYIDNIEQLLDRAKTEYQRGNTQLSFDLVSEAYLDNYEFVEGPLGEIDHELMEKIEINMREKLRSMIQNGEDFDTVSSQIDSIKEDLKVARAVVPEFGSLAVMILVVSIVSTIVLLKRHVLVTKI